jgi:predicted metal-binding protein
MIFVCEKCGKKLTKSDNPDENPSRIVQKTMKKMCVERFGKKVVRPMVSSCMDVCPEGRITVAIMPQGANPDEAKFMTFALTEPEKMAKAILDRVP